MNNEVITPKELSIKLGLSIYVIRNMLDRHEFDKDTSKSRSPIIKNEKNRQFLLEGLNNCLHNSHYCELFLSRFKRAVNILKRQRWENEIS